MKQADEVAKDLSELYEVNRRIQRFELKPRVDKDRKEPRKACEPARRKSGQDSK
jgi:hypothetical protein